MAPVPILTSYFINPSHQYVYMCISSVVVKQRLGKNTPIVGRQRLSKNVTEAMNAQERVEKLLDSSFSMRSLTYEGK
jgi:hypothetical protein